MGDVKASKSFDVKKFILKYNTIIIFVALVVVSSCLSSNFLSKMNIVNVLRQQVPYALVGIGSMLVIMTGGIDLSCGAVVGVGNVVIALLVADYLYAVIICGNFADGISRCCNRSGKRYSGGILQNGSFYCHIGSHDYEPGYCVYYYTGTAGPAGKLAGG